MAVLLDTILVFGIDGEDYFIARFDISLHELFRIGLSHAVHSASASEPERSFRAATSPQNWNQECSGGRDGCEMSHN
jgi:hypothetical protein